MIIHPQGRQEGVPPSKTDALLIELLKNIFAENVKKIVFASHTKNGFLQPSHSNNNQDGNSIINHVANISLCIDITRVDDSNF
jgi:hypothetical protein